MFATLNSWESLAAINNVIHELGHAFSSVLGQSPEKAVPSDYNYKGGKYNLIGPGGFAFPPYRWVQHDVNTQQERFADMFLGWAYGIWANDDIGGARGDFMDTNMPLWVNKSINQ